MANYYNRDWTDYVGLQGEKGYGLGSASGPVSGPRKKRGQRIRQENISRSRRADLQASIRADAINQSSSIRAASAGAIEHSARLPDEIAFRNIGRTSPIKSWLPQFKDGVHSWKPVSAGEARRVNAAHARANATSPGLSAPSGVAPFTAALVGENDPTLRQTNLAQRLKHRGQVFDAFAARPDYQPELEVRAARMGRQAHRASGQGPEFAAKYISRARQAELGTQTTAKMAGKMDVMNDVLDDMFSGAGITQGTKDPGSLSGRAYRSLYPKHYAALENKVLNAPHPGSVKSPDGLISTKNLVQKMELGGLIGDDLAVREAGVDFGKTMRQGQGVFGLNMKNRLYRELGGSAFRGADTMSKAVLGASLGQMGFATAAVAGLSYAAGSQMGYSNEEMMAAPGKAKQWLRESSRPSYGSSQLGESTQGLTLALSNRRRG